MIILKDIPGLTTADIMAAVADRIPTDQIETGHGGLVVDEHTALIFLQRYLDAVAGNPPPTQEDEQPGDEPGVVIVEESAPKRGVGRPRKDIR